MIKRPVNVGDVLRGVTIASEFTVVGIFANEGANVRLIGAVLLEANDEWQLQHNYMHGGNG
jgi:hypothetical protein